MSSYQYLPSVSTTSSSSSTTPAPTAANVYEQALANAMGIAATPYQPYQGQQVAGFTPDALAGFQAVRNMQGIQTPYLNQAANLYKTQTDMWRNPELQTAENYYNQAISLSDPNKFSMGSLQRYMNPYQQQVIDATMAQMLQNQNEMFGKNNARSVMGGTFGGSGQALGRAEMARQLGLNNAQTLAQLNAQNFSQAVAQYNQQQAQAAQAYQNAAQNLGQLGQNQQQLGVNAYQQAAQGVGNLGAQAQQGALAGATALLAAGQQQQALQQAQLDKAYEQWQQSRAYPYQQATFLAGIAGALAPQLGSSSTGSSTEVGIRPYQNQSQNVLGQILGGVTSLAGLAMPNKKDGGRVGFADGGFSSSGPYENKGFGSLIQKRPYDLDDDYVLQAMKLLNVVPASANSYAQQSNSALAQMLSRSKSRMDSGEDDSTGSAGTGLEDILSSLGTIGKAGKSLYSKYGSDVKKTLGSLFSADGGRVGYDNGGAARDQSQEDKDYLTSLYDTMFHRAPDTGGFNYWLDQLQSGVTPDQVRQGFLNSAEYNDLFAQSARPNPPNNSAKAKADAQYVLQLYKDITGKNPTQSGFEDLIHRLNYGASRDQIRRQIEGSPEKIKGDLASLYDARNAVSNVFAPGDVASGWAALDPSGGISKAIAREKAISPSSSGMSTYDMLLQQARDRNPGPQLTPEQQGMPPMPGENYYKSQLPTYNFYTQQQNPDWAGGTATTTSSGSPDANTAFLTNLYNRAFMRKPDPEGLAYWQNRMATGTSPEQVRHDFDVSKEHFDTAPVQGYFTKIASNEINPETGLFNLEYIKPYYGRPTPSNLNTGGSVGRARGGSVMSKEDIARAALQAGATPQEAAILTAIAMPESSGNPYAHNPNRKTGDNSYGLWQINMLGRMGPERMRQFGLSSYNDLFDPVTNAKAALQLLRGKRGLKNWTTYTSGKFRPYYTTAANIVNSLVKNPDAVKAPITMPERTYASDHPRRGFFSRLLSEFSPISTAQAGESVLARINPKDPSGPLLPAQDDVFKRGSAEQRIMGHRGSQPTKEGLGLITQPGGYDTFKRAPEWDTLAMGASPTRYMFGETPERVSSADFPGSAEPMGTGFDEKVVAETPEEVVAGTAAAGSPNHAGRKYWGDYRDVENSSFGDFIDTLAGDIRKADLPGTRETPMGKYQGEGGLGALFDLEGSNPYASQKQDKGEENFDLGNLFGIFG